MEFLILFLLFISFYLNSRENECFFFPRHGEKRSWSPMEFVQAVVTQD